MPMPKPMMDEEHDAFMDRCMGDGMMNEDYPDGDQRMKVCQVQWDDRKKAKAMPKPHDDESHSDFMDRCMSHSAMMDEHGDHDERSDACELIWDDMMGGKRHQPHALKHFVVPAQFKLAGDKSLGNFSGYASVFENVDLGGDVIRRGAFKEFIKNGNDEVKVLFQHDSGGPFGGGAAGGLPIGLATIEQNSKGLKFDGRLVMDDIFVRDRIYPAMKAGTIDGMSIGYDVLPGGYNILESGIRELTGIKLWEISAVTFGMNPKARIDDVKSIAPCRSIRECEDLLRDAVGLSRAQAKLHAGAIWKTLTGQRDADGGASDVQRIIGLLGSIKPT